MAIRVDIQDPFERTKLFFDHISGEEVEGYWDSRIWQHIKLLSVEQKSPSTATATFALFIDQTLCNRMNNLHGGCAATILDCVTSVALAPVSRRGFWEYAGVSRSLNCTYLRPGRLGTQATIVCEVVHVGKRLAQLRGEILGAQGELLCYCEHGKANIDPEVAKI